MKMKLLAASVCVVLVACGAANVCTADLARITEITAPPGSSDNTSHPNTDSVYSVTVPPYPLNTSLGIGYLINPTWSTVNPAADFTLHDHVYDAAYVPDPDRANIIFQFDERAVVDQLQVIEHIRGITRIQAYAGDDLSAMTLVGEKFGSLGDVTGWTALGTEGITNTFDFDNTLAGYYFKFVVTKTSWVDGWAAYRVFPTDSGGNSYGPADSPVAPVPVPGAALLGVLGLSFAGWRLKR
jgi:hypothetical protein